MKNKNVSLILLLSVFVVITGVIFLKNYETETLVEAKWNEKEDALLAITIDGEEAESFPTTRFFAATVECTNGNGEAVWNGTKWVFNVNSITTSKSFCNINFTTMENTVYQQLLSDYTNNKGVQKTTDENGKEIYYYTGNITNNNVVLNNFCWKMIRTSETDGIKMIYNGVYNETTKCNNTGENTQIGKSYYNNKTDTYAGSSLAYVGYMYNKVYPIEVQKLTDQSKNYYFGKSVSYSSTTKKYTLKTTKTATITDIATETMANYGYTCLSSTLTSCSTVYYVVGSHTHSGTTTTITSRTIDYYSLTGGTTIGSAVEEMLHATDVNKTNSTVKTYIDNWYKNNMTNVTNYLENAIFCNNRTISNWGIYSPSSNNYNPNNRLLLSPTKLTCDRVTDQFTLSVENGGTEGFGNNKLTYPVGMLNFSEARLADTTGYLKSGTYYNLFTPFGMAYSQDGYHVDSSGNINGMTTASAGVRPVISLRNTIKITGGTGEIEEPYTVSLPN